MPEVLTVKEIVFTHMVSSYYNCLFKHLRKSEILYKITKNIFHNSTRISKTKSILLYPILYCVPTYSLCYVFFPNFLPPLCIVSQLPPSFMSSVPTLFSL